MSAMPFSCFSVKAVVQIVEQVAFVTNARG
jgi:hypothetical protein